MFQTNVRLFKSSSQRSFGPEKQFWLHIDLANKKSDVGKCVCFKSRKLFVLRKYDYRFDRYFCHLIFFFLKPLTRTFSIIFSLKTVTLDKQFSTKYYSPCKGQLCHSFISIFLLFLCLCLNRFAKLYKFLFIFIKFQIYNINPNIFKLLIKCKFIFSHRD